MVDVLKAWDLNPIRVIEEIHQGYVHRITTVDDVVLVLKDIGEPDEGLNRGLELHYEILKHLSAESIPVPLPILNRNGKITSEQAGHLYILTPGLRSGPPPSDAWGRAELYRNYGIAIAMMHLALKSFRSDKLEALWKTNPSAAIPNHVSIIRENIDGGRLSTFNGIVGNVEPEMRVSFEGLGEQLIHRDCHPGNVVVHGTEVTGIVDCDHFSIGPRLVDLAYFTAHFVMRQSDDEEVCKAWLNDFPMILEGYHETSPLSVRERQAFPYMMMYIYLLFASWMFENSEGEGTEDQLNALEWMHLNLETVVENSNRISGREGTCT